MICICSKPCCSISCSRQWPGSLCVQGDCGLQHRNLRYLPADRRLWLRLRACAHAADHGRCCLHWRYALSPGISNHVCIRLCLFPSASTLPCSQTWNTWWQPGSSSCWRQSAGTLPARPSWSSPQMKPWPNLSAASSPATRFLCQLTSSSHSRSSTRLWPKKTTKLGCMTCST